MENDPTQTLIVRIPVEKARQLKRLVYSENSAYSSIDEFIRIAIENQLTLEGGSSDISELKGPNTWFETPSTNDNRKVSFLPEDKIDVDGHRDEKPSRVSLESMAATADFEMMLKRPISLNRNIRRSMPTTGLALSSFTNRLAPVLAGPRVLTNLTGSANSPTVDQYLDLTAKAARAFGHRLREEDDAVLRRGRHRRSTAWPIGEDESKSLIRYRNCFMFYAEKGGAFAGLLLELGLVAIYDGLVFLTETGTAFAEATSPALDDPNGIEVLSSNHQSILAAALVQIPGELEEIQRFLNAVELSGGLQDDVDKELATDHKEWSEAQVVSHRAAIVGRLRDLLVIEVKPLDSAKSKIVEGDNYGTFLGLISQIER